MMTPDVNVAIINFTAPGKEMVVPNEDGSYTILINAKLSNDGQMLAYKHAMKHITANDFEKENVQKIEAAAHEMISDKKFSVLSSAEYEQRIQKIRAERRQLKRKMKKQQKKIEFMQEHNYDFFEIAEHNYLYGHDL